MTQPQKQPEGEALLLALVRRKGSPAALADWLLERVPDDDFVEDLDPHKNPWLLYVRSRTLVAALTFAARKDSGLWVRMWLNYRHQGHMKTYGPCFHIDLASPDCGRWLAQYLNETFLRRHS